jgi:sphingosine kinase
MVDLDIGTENLRWMGDTRFIVGFLRGIVTNKNHKCRLKLKVVENDKVEMARAARERAREVRGHTVVGGGVNPAGLTHAMTGRKVDRTDAAERKESAKMESEVAPGKGTGEEDEMGQRANGGGNKGEGANSDGLGDGTIAGDRAEDGPLPDAKPLEPDSTWTTIESTGKAPPPPSLERRVDYDEWVDGQGILYV